MAENSKIEWTNHTVNLWWGCSKVHTGCKNCYADELSKRFDGGVSLWGEKAWRKPIKSAFKDLKKYEKIGKTTGIKQKVFVGSMMDIFEDPKPLLYHGKIIESPDYTSGLRSQLFQEIQDGDYDNLIFLFLTKRPQNIPMYIPEEWSFKVPDNVWFGTSISDQETVRYADDLRYYAPGKLFLSIEPQVGIIEDINLDRIKWVIQGGESGDKRRPFMLTWAYLMSKICEKSNVPYFFKQIDKIQQIPEVMLIRQFPEF